MPSAVGHGEVIPPGTVDTPPAKFLAAVRGVVRAAGARPAIGVIVAGFPGTPAIDESTRFRVGSLSKIFTAIGVLRLVQQGSLTLDAELIRLLPEFKFRNDFKTAEPIRVEHLLSHSSGLPVEAKAELTFVSSWQLDELVPLLEHHALAFPPGQRAQYSNVGYDVLGLVIERVSGQSFERYMHEHVFTALGMTSAGYHPDGNTVPGFFRDADGAVLESPEQPANELPAGGLLLSARDFAAFLGWLLEPSESSQAFLRNSLKQLLLMPSAYRPLDGVRQQPGVPAVGFYIEQRFGRVMAFHTGSKPGYLAYCHVLPDAGLATFTFVTGPFAPVREIWEYHLANLESLLAEAPPSSRASAAPLLGTVLDTCLSELASYEPSADELEACAGRYGVVGYYDVAFTVSGRTLRTDYGEMGELVPVAAHEFVAARYLPGERLRFVKAAEEKAASAVYVSLTLHTRLEGELLLRHEQLKAERFGRSTPSEVCAAEQID